MNGFGKRCFWIGMMVVLFPMLTACQFAPLPPLPTSTPTASVTPSPFPTATATATPTSTPSPVPSPTASATPTQAPASALATPLPITPFPRLSAGPVTLLWIQMVDPQRGWAVGFRGKEDEASHHVLHTQDGGLHWRDVSPPWVGIGRYPELVPWDAQTAWVAYPAEGENLAVQAVVWRTQDAGQTWQAAPVPLGDLENMVPHFHPLLTAADAQHLWLLGHLEGGMHHDYSALFASTDAGASWKRLVTPYDPSADDLMLLYTSELAFTPDGYGLAAKTNGPMEGGVVVITEDGGYTWRGFPITPPVPGICDTYDLHLWARGHATFTLFCWGEANTAFVVHMKTEQVRLYPLPAHADRIHFFTPERGYAFGPSRGVLDRETFQSWLYITQDGGQTWQLVRQVNWQGRFFFLDETHVWAVARGPQETVLTISTDGGRSWGLLRPLIYTP